MDSITRRVAALEQAIEAANAAETVRPIQLVTVFTRGEVEAMRRLRESMPPTDWPKAKGRIRLEFSSITAAEYLKQRGMEAPAWTEEEKKLYDIEPQTGA